MRLDKSARLRPQIIALLMLFSACLSPFVVNAFTNECALNFRQVARLRRSPDYKNNPQMLIWMYEEAGLHRAANRLRAKVEETLRSGRVIGEPEKIKMDDGNMVEVLNFGNGIKALRKLKTSGTVRDVTTYRFDRFTRARQAPINAETEYEGRKIIVQLYVPDTDGAAMANNPHGLSLYDFLLNHTDRHEKNHLSFHGRGIAIDNENAFSLGKGSLPVPDFPSMIMNALKESDPIASANIIAPTLISREFVEKLRTATNAEWRDVLRELTDPEFEAFLLRKSNAVTAIHIAERKLGSAIYPSGPYSALSRDPWAIHTTRMHEAGRDDRVPAELKSKLRMALDLIERETLFRQPLTSSQRQKVEDILMELDAYR